MHVEHYDEWTGGETLIGQYIENGHTIDLYKADNGYYRARIDQGMISTPDDLAYSASSPTLALSLAKGYCKA